MRTAVEKTNVKIQVSGVCVSDFFEEGKELPRTRCISGLGRDSELTGCTVNEGPPGTLTLYFHDPTRPPGAHVVDPMFTTKLSEAWP